MEHYRLDRTAFKIQTFEQATRQETYWYAQSAQKRLSAAWYLICAAYNLDYYAENRLDRNYFHIRKRDE